MQQEEFEQHISKFFDKAGVRLLKRGSDYDNNINYPAYILLDAKRKSYYFTETDVQTISTEIEPTITNFAEDSNLPLNVAYPLYKIGQDISANNNQFSIEKEDLSILECKSSLIISEENSTVIKEYLTNNAFKFQTVPLKGQFLVIFFDKGMENNLIELYSKYDVATNSTIEDDIAPVFTPKDDSDVENINLSTAQKDNFDAETPIVEPREEINSDTPQEEVPETAEEIAEDELLESIDLSDLLKPAKEEDAPKDETEADLLYGKLINEQAEQIEVSKSGPVEKTLDEIPDGIISSEDIQDMSENSNDSSVDKKTAKKLAKEAKKQAKIEKKQQKKAEKYTYENRNKPWLDVPGKIATNIIAIIFFLPVYVLNKIVGRFLPPFVLYWFAAIIAIYGGYQIVYSLLPQPLSDVFVGEVNNALSNMQTHIVEITEEQDLNGMIGVSLEMMKSSSVVFYSSLQGVDMLMNKGYLLQYLLGFGASILIFPAFRFIGKTITIFSILSYFMLPVVTYSQAMLIKHSFELPEISLTAAAIQFIVYIYPLLLLFTVLYISSALVPDENTRKEVLP